MKKISKLTKEQEEYIPVHINKYIRKAMEPIDHELKRWAVNSLYKREGKNPPLILYFENPIQCKLFQLFLCRSQLYSQFRSQLDSQLDFEVSSPLKDKKNYFWVNIWWLYMAGWYTYMKYIGIVFEKEAFDLFTVFCENTCFCIPYGNLYLYSEKPIEVNWKNKLLHCDGDAAIKFKGEYALYFLNGVAVSKEIACTPAEELNPEIILTEKNAEIRREIVRKIGIERIIQKMECKTLDTWKDYTLLEFPHIKGMQTKGVYLKMKNPSTGTIHIEGVSPEIKTVAEALNWRIGGLSWNPIQLT